MGDATDRKSTTQVGKPPAAPPAGQLYTAGMSAKQFGHFLSLQQQLAGMRRSLRRPVKAASRSNRSSTVAVAEAKDWLAGAARGR
jgi:hypothetical protein